jgi:hypothetical protein
MLRRVLAALKSWTVQPQTCKNCNKRIFRSFRKSKTFVHSNQMNTLMCEINFETKQVRENRLLHNMAEDLMQQVEEEREARAENNWAEQLIDDVLEGWSTEDFVEMLFFGVHAPVIKLPEEARF